MAQFPAAPPALSAPPAPPCSHRPLPPHSPGRVGCPPRPAHLPFRRRPWPPRAVTAAPSCETWPALDLSGRRAVVREVMTVTLIPAGRGARTFDPMRRVMIEWNRPE